MIIVIHKASREYLIIVSPSREDLTVVSHKACRENLIVVSPKVNK